MRLLRLHLEARKDARALSPVIKYADPGQGDVWFAGGVLDSGWPRHLQPHEFDTLSAPTRGSDVLSGCCIAASAATWRAVGGFDEDFFLIH